MSLERLTFSKKQFPRHILLRGLLQVMAMGGAENLCSLWTASTSYERALKIACLGVLLSGVVYPCFRALFLSVSPKNPLRVLGILLLMSYVSLCFSHGFVLEGFSGNPLYFFTGLGVSLFFVSWLLMEFLLQSQINSPQEKSSQNNAKYCQGMHAYQSLLIKTSSESSHSPSSFQEHEGEDHPAPAFFNQPKKG